MTTMTAGIRQKPREQVSPFNPQFSWLSSKTSYLSGETTVSQTPVALTPQEIVSFFQEEGLPIAAIADIARVERKTIYAWLQDGEVKSHNQQRLLQLYEIMNSNKTASFKHLYRLWHRPLPQGATLGKLLHEEPLDRVAIKETLDLLWPLAKKHQEQSEKRPQFSDMKKNPLLAEIPTVFISDDE